MIVMMMMMMNCYGFVVQLLVGMSKCRGFLYICCRRFSKVILLYICCVFHLVDNHCFSVGTLSNKFTAIRGNGVWVRSIDIWRRAAYRLPAIDGTDTAHRVVHKGGRSV